MDDYSPDLFLKKQWRCTVTGFTGTATRYITELFGTDSAYLEGPAGDDGKLTGHWFEVTRLEPATGSGD